MLREALDLFRGPSLAGLSGRLIEAAAAAWDQRRLTLVEAYCEHLLALGRHREAAAELAALVAEHPLRENAVRLLMLARYREGRRAEALARYLDTRALLADELGIDPRPDLQRLHQQILEDDAALAPEPAGIAVPSGSPEPGENGGGFGPRGAPVVPRQLPAGARMIMMPYRRPWPSPQLTGQADFWYPTGSRGSSRGGAEAFEALFEAV